jgi:hypothetical protein
MGMRRSLLDCHQLLVTVTVGRCRTATQRAGLPPKVDVQAQITKEAEKHTHRIAY